MGTPGGLRATLWHCQAAIWTAGLLLPSNRRESWRSEQNRKFWHWCLFLAESRQLSAQNRLLIARACWRLFPEAFWLRFDHERFESRRREALGSPGLPLAALTIFVAVLALSSGVISAGRLALHAPVPNPDRTVIITLDGNGMNGNYSRTRSDTLLDLASIWQKSKLSEGLSPFSWAPGHLALARRDLAIASARVGPDFFATLGVKPQMGRVFTRADLQACPTCVVLSYGLWHHEFRADPNIVGKQVDVNGVPRTVIGVLPSTFRLISPGIAVWGLMDPSMLFTNFQRRVGAVARLHSGASAISLQHDITDLTESAGYVHPSSQIQVLTVAAQQRKNLAGMVWFVLLAAGCAAAVVVLRSASHGFGRMPEGASARVLWLCFLAAKSTLLVSLAALSAWTVVHWLSFWLVGSTNPAADEYAIWLFLPLATVALSWSVDDQQKRCRVCLQRLELPVEIGRTGSVLLNWSGTEMVCPRGHGVLYLPDSEANSLDQDRWNKLDDSWEGLFRP